MSPSVMTLPAMNFKFLTKGSLEEGEIIDFAKKRIGSRSGALV
jgi:hypothetical protein